MTYPIPRHAKQVVNSAKKDDRFIGRLLHAAYADYEAEPSGLHHNNITEILESIIEDEFQIFRTYTKTAAHNALTFHTLAR